MMISAEVISQFASAMRANGIEPPDRIEADGVLHRFEVNGEQGKRSGAYRLYVDGRPAGWFQSWKTGAPIIWRADAPACRMTAEQSRMFRREVAERRSARDAAKSKAQAVAAEVARERWMRATPADPAHHYLRRKGVQPYGIRQHDDLLLVPLRDADGVMQSLQTIDGEGVKLFAKDGRTAGLYHAIGQAAGAMIICEGYSTGASLHEATGHAVAVAFTCGNLLAVAEVLRAKVPDAVLIIAADDDAGTPGNPGLRDAAAAARAVGGMLAMPDFGDHRPGKATDFNDLHLLRGVDAVRACLAAAKPAGESSAAVERAPAGAEGCDPTASALEGSQPFCGDANTVAKAAEDGDVGAPFEPAALTTLCNLRAQRTADWIRLRERLKRCGVSVIKLEQEMRRLEGPQADDEQTVADRLIAMARSQCNFMHDAQREPYAVFEASGARQVHGVLSAGFSDYLSHAYYTQHDRAPSEQSLKVALATLRGHAQFEGELCEVFTRIAKTETGYWLDLCNDAWQCVQITATGWAVVAGEAAPLFGRTPSMRPLPLPEQGGTLDPLWPLVNIPESDRLPVLTWLLECLRPETPHPVLELVGEQGSAKSSTQRSLRRLIDPNQADLRAAPKNVDDVWIAARNSHMVSLENLSHLAPAYQDALCVLATGGGYSARTLYTNAHETILELRKPIVLNGISVIVTAQDLLDRCLHVELPTVHKREMASEMETRFEAAQPALLGALLDLFVKVLAMLPNVVIEPDHRPRMADFAALGEAVFRVHGEPPGAFLAGYAAKRRDGVLRTIDSSPVGAALVAFLERAPDGFSGTLSELLERLDRYRTHGEAWPRTPKGLGDVLRRLAPAMRMIGYECKPAPKIGGVIRWGVLRTNPPADLGPASPVCPDEGAPGAPRLQASSAPVGHAGYAGLASRSPARVNGVLVISEIDFERFA
jgi:phage/plasmid primase-like uncharacterized protein